MESSFEYGRTAIEQGRIWLYVVAGLSVTAGVIHVAAMPEHFAEWIGYGLFFLIAAVAQLVYPLILLTEGPKRTLLLAGIWGNAFIIALYIVSRTVGIPFGPSMGEVEPVQALDAVSKLAELILICCLFLRLNSTPMRMAGSKEED